MQNWAYENFDFRVNVLYPLCGISLTDVPHRFRLSSLLNVNNSIGTLVITNCWLWFAFCLVSKTVGHQVRRSIRKLLLLVGPFIFVTSWKLCMIWLFYQFALFFQDSYISPTWSFGQIIAVTIWAPCVVEYIDIEISKFHRDIVPQVVFTINPEQMGSKPPLNIASWHQ